MQVPPLWAYLVSTLTATAETLRQPALQLTLLEHATEDEMTQPPERASAFCPTCRKETSTTQPAGPYLETTDCCGEPVLYRDEQSFCENFQLQLADRLRDDNTLPLASLLLIEQMLKPVKLPTLEKQVPKVSR